MNLVNQLQESLQSHNLITILLRPVPTRSISSRSMAKVGRLESEILNMFNTGSRPTIPKSVVESADSGIELADSTVELADSTTDSAANPLKSGLWVRALTCKLSY